MLLQHAGAWPAHGPSAAAGSQGPRGSREGPRYGKPPSQCSGPFSAVATCCGARRGSPGCCVPAGSLPLCCFPTVTTPRVPHSGPGRKLRSSAPNAARSSELDCIAYLPLLLLCSAGQGRGAWRGTGGAVHAVHVVCDPSDHLYPFLPGARQLGAPCSGSQGPSCLAAVSHLQGRSCLPSRLLFLTSRPHGDTLGAPRG